MSHIKTYSDFTNTKFAEVWDVNIIELFQMLAFVREYRKREQEKIREYQKNHKW